MIRRRSRRRRTGVLDVLDGIEIVVYLVGALVLLPFLLFLGVRSAHRLAGPVASGVAIACVVVVVALTARDAIRRRWTPVSIGVGAAYALCLVALIAADAFVG